MNKAFVREEEQGQPEGSAGAAESALPDGKNYMTPAGANRLLEELKHLKTKERPEVVKIVEWAAGNGDRSENGDYIYGKKRLREIDRRMAHLSRIMKAAKIIDPASQQSRDQVRFGATVELADEADNRRMLTIVGDDEADASVGRIGWSAPIARALIGARKGEERIVRLPSGEKSYEIMAI